MTEDANPPKDRTQQEESSGSDATPGPDAKPVSPEREVVDPNADGATLATAGGDGDQIDPANEVELWSGRTAWLHYAGRLATWLVGLIAVLVVLIWRGQTDAWLTFSWGLVIFLVVLIASGIWLGRRPILEVLGHRYRVTTQRLFIERGILSQTVDQTELVRVDDVRMYKSVTDRLFGLGSVAVISTDATDREVVIVGITEPDKVAEAIRTRMRTMRRKSLFVENL